MTATLQSSKLAELRAKTDRDLALLISNALEVGLLLAENEPDVDPVGVLHRRAAQIHNDSMMLLQKLEDAGERWRLKAKLNQLREALDQRVQMAGASV